MFFHRVARLGCVWDGCPGWAFKECDSISSLNSAAQDYRNCIELASGRVSRMTPSGLRSQRFGRVPGLLVSGDVRSALCPAEPVTEAGSDTPDTPTKPPELRV